MTTEEFLEKYVIDRRGTNCSKWDGVKAKFGEEELLPFWIADMEFRTCDAIIDAMTKRVQHGAFGYSFVPDGYYDAFIKWMDTRYGWKIDKDWVRFCTGCVTALAWAIHAFTKPGDACQILTPVYYPFHNVVTNNNRTLVRTPLDYDGKGHFSMNFERIESDIADKNVKMLLLCSPHNPAGRVWTEAELDRLLSICARHGVLVVSDEIHQDIVFAPATFVPAATVSGGKYADNLITLNSSSKTFNIATLIHSHIIISNDKMRAEYDKFASGLNRTEASIMGTVATQAGYESGGEWLENVLNVIASNYAYMKSELESSLPGVVVCEMEGTYLPLVDLRAVCAPEKTHEFVQGAARLAVDYGEWFGDGYEGFVRINMATDPKFVREAVKRIKDAASQRK